MRNWFFIGFLVVIIIALTITVGVLIYNNISMENKIAEQENKIYENEIVENMINSNIDVIETTALEEERTSPNCIFIFKTYYRGCEHIKVEKEQIEEVMVNKTREDLEKIYRDWKIVTFRKDEVLFYKEEDGICDEHFLLKDLEGHIAIYTLDEKDNETLKETTSIITDFLEEEDLQKLKEGIRIEGKEQLNKTLEDYE